ncbi:glucose-1-phosphate adenylyltransferase [Acidobacteria bacterium ACD]|nr:MAG: glucose-1-phosphate adenylyltransferase [Acidobacteriota bacterium]MCE7960233.1 glucose-1-phosphate adenylyltransferase [Acidobacteria bacterium ACB2]MDL1950646.1 glucose-1-phosphate adenylyltransferase [Acidobacteria bacterium ACD]
MSDAEPRVYTVILGGGRGTRLYPLTRDRAKPAVPLAGKYRLIDIPVSNAINSGFKEIAVLTQFNSLSLNSHVSAAYRFDVFSRGSVEIFAAEQTESGGAWFEGTADAVRKLLGRIGERRYDHVLILSGDHLYRMDYGEMLARHLAAAADVTVSVLPVAREECGGFGVLSAAGDGRIVAFREKPRADEDLTALAPPDELRDRWGIAPGEFLASMGVYVFRMDVLKEALEDPAALDFGKDILPRMIGSHRVHSFLFRGYWRDIGTIDSFFEANLAITDEEAPFRFFHGTAPIYTRLRFLPASRVLDARISRSVVSDGCLVYGAEVDHCVVGIRSRIQKGSRLKDVILMGADDYEDDDVRAALAARGVDAVGVGPDCVVERAIIDKNARIGASCVLRGDPSRPDTDGDGWYLRDGILIVPKNGRIPAGTVV